MAVRPPPPPLLMKAMLFRFHSHAIPSLTRQNDLNITLTQLCRDGQFKHAMHILLATNTHTHSSLRSSTCLQLLQTCIAHNALPEAKLLHSLINRIQLQFSPSTNKLLQNRLIHMYINSGSLADALEVFDCMTERDIFSWTMIISGYQRHGFPQQALTLFHQMQQIAAAVQPDQFTFPIILNSCAKLGDLQHGIYIHQRLFKRGFLSDVVVVSAMVDMYAKCGSVEKARELFDKMDDANTVSWTAMIAGYAQNGYVARARELFDKMLHRNAVSWNAMIAGYAQNGFSEKALETFKQMQLSGVKPDSATFASILPACASMDALGEDVDIHQRVVGNGFSSNVVIVSDMNITLIQLCRDGRLKDAMHMLTTNTETYYSLCSSTCLQLLRTCIANNALPEGKLVHSLINRIGLKFGPSINQFMKNRIIHMYVNCGSLTDAREVFDYMTERDILSWNMIISGYQRHGFPRQALTLFYQMQQTTAVVQPDQFTFPSVLKACIKLGHLQHGLYIHQRLFKSGFLSHVVVVTAVVDMYANCGSIEKAHELFDKMHVTDTVLWTAMIAGYAQNGYIERACELFDKMSHRDVASWNAMIVGYAQNGFSEKALEIFKQMQLSDVKPNFVTFASILPACAIVGALEEGVDIHKRVVENGFTSNVVVASALIDMYAKCGEIHKARELFDNMHDANTVSWTSMIGGYAIHGHSKDALKLFDLMKHLGTKPNSITFVCVLLACSHAGLVDEGCKYFDSMSDSYCIIPRTYHYTCIVDLLGRAGYLEEALNFIVKMPITPKFRVWMCLLGACRSHKNVGMGEFVATILFLLEPNNDSSCVLLSNIYAEVGCWDDVQRIRTLMKGRGIKKIPGCSWIEVEKRVHAFLVGDSLHPQTQEI